MNRHDIFAELRQIFVEFYTDSATVNRVADDCGLQLERFDSGANLQNKWHEVLKEALKQNKLNELIKCLSKDFPSNTQKINKARQLANKLNALPELDSTKQQFPRNNDELINCLQSVCEFLQEGNQGEAIFQVNFLMSRILSHQYKSKPAVDLLVEAEKLAVQLGRADLAEHCKFLRSYSWFEAGAYLDAEDEAANILDALVLSPHNKARAIWIQLQAKISKIERKQHEIEAAKFRQRLRLHVEVAEKYERLGLEAFRNPSRNGETDAYDERSVWEDLFPEDNTLDGFGDYQDDFRDYTGYYSAKVYYSWAAHAWSFVISQVEGQSDELQCLLDRAQNKLIEISTNVLPDIDRELQELKLGQFKELQIRLW